MRKNVFLKSVLRQPIRAFLLAVLIAAAAFAFVARATEYRVISDEITRIEQLYRAIGVLQPLHFNDFTYDHDVTRVAALLADSPLVGRADARVFAQGVMHDHRNLIAQSTWGFLNPEMHGLDLYAVDHYFIGTLRRMPIRTQLQGRPAAVLNLQVDEMIQGDPTALRVGDREFTNAQGQVAVIRGFRDFRLILTEEELALMNAGEWNPLDDLYVDGQFLFRVTPAYMDNEGRMIWYLRAVMGVDALGFGFVYEDGHYLQRFVTDAAQRDTHDALTFFVNAEDETAMEAAMAYNDRTLALHDNNLSMMTVIGTQDMTAIPRFMRITQARLLDTPRFPGGRWLTYEDYLYNRHVAVIPAQLAIRRGIQVGDTITLTLRNQPRPPWIDHNPRDTSVWFSRGVEGWWDNYPAGWWGMTYTGHTDWRSFPTHEAALEVVGIYWYTPPGGAFTNFTSAEIYVPAGIIPEGFGWEDMPLLTGMYNFMLNSPRDEERFLRDYREPLAALGFVPIFVPTGFDVLVRATDPIRTSITVNLAIFGAVSVMILALVVFLYVRQWRRSVAITKALGLPSTRVMGWLFVPVLCIWIPAMLAGAWLGWHFALGEAEAVLRETFAYDYDAAALISAAWLGAMASGMALVMCAGVFGGAYNLIRRPVLEQLQGGTQKRLNIQRVESGELPEGFTVQALSLSTEPLRKSRVGAWRASLRHGLRHILRSPVKTGLAAALALLFVFSLGWLDDTIHFTEAEIERLWTETRIYAELVPIPQEDFEETAWWPSMIAPTSWDLMLASGFVTEAYLEGFVFGHWLSYLNSFVGVSHLDGFIAENTKTAMDEHLGVACDDIEIEFAPGFGPEDFIFVSGQPVPMIVPRHLLYVYEDGYIFEMGEVFTFDRSVIDFVDWGMHFAFGTVMVETRGRIIGVYDGGLQRGILRSGLPTVVPMEAFYYIADGNQWFHTEWAFLQTGRPAYMTTRFVVDTTRNRELDTLRDFVELALTQNFLGRFFGQQPLELVLDDSVIHNVIIPMERNLSLLRVLYPIAIGAAFVLSLGLSLLTMLQSAKNAAILRVLGKTRANAQFALIAEQLIVCLVGVTLGLLIMPLLNVALGLIAVSFAGLYLAGALVGSFIGAVVISAKTPLELLQVRE
ncbi:MAG: hypothetical protein FWC71_04500 [Defluviitaleaceae bacterium]|nr:hypothetical protein [Defluviitaleaceae bacterium]